MSPATLPFGNPETKPRRSGAPSFWPSLRKGLSTATACPATAEALRARSPQRRTCVPAACISCRACATALSAFNKVREAPQLPGQNPLALAAGRCSGSAARRPRGVGRVVRRPPCSTCAVQHAKGAQQHGCHARTAAAGPAPTRAGACMHAARCARGALLLCCAKHIRPCCTGAARHARQTHGTADGGATLSLQAAQHINRPATPPTAPGGAPCRRVPGKRD